MLFGNIAAAMPNSDQSSGRSLSLDDQTESYQLSASHMKDEVFETCSKDCKFIIIL